MHNGMLLWSIAAFFTLAASTAMARVILPIYDEKGMNEACESALSSARERVVRIQAWPAGAGSKRIFAAWNDLQIELNDVSGPAQVLAAVHPDATARAAAKICSIRSNEFVTELFQNEKLYRLFTVLKPQDRIGKRLKTSVLDSFEDRGVSLAPEKRERAKQIFQKLDELLQEFDRNVLENKTRLSFIPEEMKGMPQSYLNKAKRDEKGNFLLGFDYPDYMPFMTNADDEAARKRYFIAFTNRGTARNLELMKEIAVLRKELASLYGLASYSQFVTRRFMARNSRSVRRFLRDVKVTVRNGEDREVAAMRQLKAQQLGKSSDEVNLYRWDVLYYQERTRKAHYNIDQEALRMYFPVPAVVKYALLVSRKLYGVKFRRRDVPVWHKDVLYYDVLDEKTGRYLSGIYLDLYPREGKYRHAATFPCRDASTLARRTPIAALVANFDRDGLTHGEMQTLLHEFGHILHSVLSTTKYIEHAGINVELDFVEAPSQMFEEWARRPEALVLLRKVCADCPNMNENLIGRLDEASRYGNGVHYSRQHFLASFDQAMTSENPGDPLETWNRMEVASVLGHVEGTLGPSAFPHNVNHYGAGYYGYLWSEMLALDMLSAFDGNVMDPVAGRHFRKTILANGGQEPAKNMVRQFLGREPNSRAFFAEINGKR